MSQFKVILKKTVSSHSLPRLRKYDLLTSHCLDKREARRSWFQTSASSPSGQPFRKQMSAQARHPLWRGPRSLPSQVCTCGPNFSRVREHIRGTIWSRSCGTEMNEVRVTVPAVRPPSSVLGHLPRPPSRSVSFSPKPGNAEDEACFTEREATAACVGHDCAKCFRC